MRCVLHASAPPRPAFGGIAVERRVKATCRGPYGTFSFEFTAYIPVKKGPSPAFLLIATRDIKDKDRDLARMQKTGYWPAKEIVGHSRGVHPRPWSSRARRYTKPAGYEPVVALAVGLQSGFW